MKFDFNIINCTIYLLNHLNVTKRKDYTKDLVEKGNKSK